MILTVLILQGKNIKAISRYSGLYDFNHNTLLHLTRPVSGLYKVDSGKDLDDVMAGKVFYSPTNGLPRELLPIRAWLAQHWSKLILDLY